MTKDSFNSSLGYSNVTSVYASGTNTVSNVLMGHFHKPALAGYIADARTLFIISIAGPAVALMLLLNRIFLRLRIVGRAGTDDFIIAIATFFLFGLCAANSVAICFGYGQHVADIPTENVPMVLFWFWLLQIFYKLAINTTKLAILSLYGRIFHYNDHITTCVLYGFGTVFVAGSAFTLATVFQCNPIHDAWAWPLVKDHCNNTAAFWEANAIWNIVSDVLLILLPLPIIRILHISRIRKLGLTAMFSIGITVIVTAILRFTTLRSAAAKSTFDPSFGTLTSTAWTAGEASLAVICANIPMLRQLIQALIPALRDSIPRTTRSSMYTFPSIALVEGGTEIPEWTYASPRVPAPNDDSASTLGLLEGRSVDYSISRPMPVVLSRFINSRREVS